MKIYCSKGSSYFFAKGVLYRIKDEKSAGIFNPPLSYNDMKDVVELAKKSNINLEEAYDIGKLEELIAALSEREKPREQTGGMFVGINKEGGGKGKIIHTGKIVRFDELRQEQLVKLLN